MLKSAGINPDAMKLEDIEKPYNTLAADRKRAYSTYKTADKKSDELQKIRDDLEAYAIAESSRTYIKGHTKDNTL